MFPRNVVMSVEMPAVWILDILQSLSFLVNWKKSDVAPSKIMEYLGMIVDSLKMSFSLPAIKVQEVKRL